MITEGAEEADSSAQEEVQVEEAVEEVFQKWKKQGVSRRSRRRWFC